MVSKATRTFDPIIKASIWYAQALGCNFASQWYSLYKKRLEAGSLFSEGFSGKNSKISVPEAGEVKLLSGRSTPVDLEKGSGRVEIMAAD